MNEITEIDGQFSKLYEIFFKSHPTPIYVWKYCENDFILIKYNNAADTLTKGKMKDFLGIKASELYKDRPDIIEDLYRCNRNKTSFSKELKYSYQTINEEKILIANYYFMMPNLVLVHIEDISKQKFAEKALIRSEEKYRNILESIGDAIHVVDRDLRIIYSNLAFKNWLKNLNIDVKLEGKSIFEAFPFLPEKVREEYFQVFNTGETIITEETNKVKSKEILTETRKIPIIKEEKIEQIITIIRDITERRTAEQKLIKSEENYRNLVNNINDILIEVDLDRTILYISPQVYDILGYKPEEIIGTKSQDFIHPDENLFEKEDLLNALRSGEPLYKEHRIKHKDGHYLLLAMKGNVVKKDNNIKIIGVFRDITERKKAEEKLKENEKFLQNMFDAIRDGISILDRELNVVRVNRWMEEMYKDSLPLVGKKCYKVYQKRSSICPWCPSEKAFETGEIHSEVVSYPSTDNPTGWIDLSAFPLKDESGKVVNVIEYVKDITKQKIAEIKLRKERDLLDMIMQTSPAGITMVNKEGTIIYANSTAESVLGLTKDQITKRSYNSQDWIITDYEGNPFNDDKLPFKIVKTTKKVAFDIRHAIRKPNGQKILLSINSAPIFNEEGNFDGMIATVEDITEKVISEKKIQESEYKYREAYNRSNLYKDLFTHDINNILQNFLSSIELFSLRLKNKDIPQKFDEILNLIKEQITRGSKLVKNVQKLSEIEETKKLIISIDLCETLKKSIDVLRSTFYYKNIDVKVKSTQSKFFVKGNDLLPNIFENILFNAVKHNLNEKIEILIKISNVKKEKTDFIKFEFIDNGVGIPDLLKKEIFSRKLRESEKESEKEKITSGMGLGLILVKSILNSINGEIIVEDKIEGDYTKGSNFIILIPEAK